LSGHYRRLSLMQGASLCVVGIMVGLLFLFAAPQVRPLSLGFFFLLGAWLCLWFFSHDLAHHVVGRVLGVGFRYYFFGRSAITKLRLPVVSELSSKIPVLGLKIDKHTLKSVSPNKARIMYASGAISSMLLPLLVLPTAYVISTPVGILFTLLTLANSIFTIYFSSHVGDLHRAGIGHDILVSHPKPDYGSNT